MYCVEGLAMESWKVLRFCAVWVNVLLVIHGALAPFRLVVASLAVVSRRRREVTSSARILFLLSTDGRGSAM